MPTEEKENKPMTRAEKRKAKAQEAAAVKAAAVKADAKNTPPVDDTVVTPEKEEEATPTPEKEEEVMPTPEKEKEVIPTSEDEEAPASKEEDREEVVTTKLQKALDNFTEMVKRGNVPIRTLVAYQHAILQTIHTEYGKSITKKELIDTMGPYVAGPNGFILQESWEDHNARDAYFTIVALVNLQTMIKNGVPPKKGTVPEKFKGIYLSLGDMILRDFIK